MRAKRNALWVLMGLAAVLWGWVIAFDTRSATLTPGGLEPSGPPVVQRPVPAAPPRTESIPLAAKTTDAKPKSTPSSHLSPTASKATLEGLSLTSADERLLFDAQEALVASCMLERGFEYRPKPFDSESNASGGVPSAPLRSLSASDAERASTEGYGLAREAPGNRDWASSEEDDTDTLSGAERRDFQAALLGELPSDESREELQARGELVVVEIPDGPTIMWDPRSCVAMARTKLYGDWPAHRRSHAELELLLHDLDTRAASAPPLVDAMSRWRACMQEAGHDYASPAAAIDDLSSRLRGSEGPVEGLLETERTVATADVACRREVGLSSADADTRKDLEADFEREHQELLRELRQSRDIALSKAELVALQQPSR